MSAPPFLEAASLALPGLAHGFFGRGGGASGGIYAGLNAGPGSGDAADAVAENRRRIAAALCARELVSAHQVHSAKAVAVSGAWAGPRPEADGLVTATPGVGLCVLTADCTPVLFADAAAGVIGAAHAGWKGALGGVLEATVAQMEALGAQRGRIAVALGPAIAQESYEIGPEFEARFLAEDPASDPFFAPGPGAKRHFDLPGYAAMRLARAGIGSIGFAARDTYADEENFFSARRSGHRGVADYGRNASCIVLL